MKARAQNAPIVRALAAIGKSDYSRYAALAGDSDSECRSEDFVTGRPQRVGWMSNWLRDAATDVNSRRSLAGRARARRWQHLIEVFPSLSEMRVLDLGGTPESWQLAPVLPKSVTTLNVLPLESAVEGIITIQGKRATSPARSRATTSILCTPIRCSNMWAATCGAND